MLHNASLITHLSELVSDIGNIPTDRILHDPRPSYSRSWIGNVELSVDRHSVPILDAETARSAVLHYAARRDDADA